MRVRRRARIPIAPTRADFAQATGPHVIALLQTVQRGLPCRRGLAALALALSATACRSDGVLDPQGPISSAERLILINSTAIMLVVVLPVIVATLGFAWWYRAANARAAYKPDWSYSGQIELMVWSIPAMVVILLASVGWTGSHELDPARKLRAEASPLHIQVVSLDWKWLFIYPQQQVAAVNQITVPAGVPLEFDLTSASVMNAFFVPQLGSQIYTMAGMTTHLNLMADRPGDYPGLSSQFSGDGFSDMRFTVHAVTAAEFQAWLGQVRGNAPVLNADTYAQLARPIGNVTAHDFRGVDPALFATILQRTVHADVQPAGGH
jgi:cytochrome o ubiquinol oxidase subunit II